MPLTRSFKELVGKHIAEDAAFAEAFLREGVNLMLAGDMETGKAILRDHIKATVGFEKLGQATGTQPKSLIRMFGSRGNPQARNLFKVIGYLQKRAGVELRVELDRLEPVARPGKAETRRTLKPRLKPARAIARPA